MHRQETFREYLQNIVGLSESAAGAIVEKMAAGQGDPEEIRLFYKYILENENLLKNLHNY